ncbi:hypothetical protein BH24ACT15_BH24ACT15_02140 [soil metagenome]|jgi:general stress protein 26
MSNEERFYEILDDFDTCILTTFKADGMPNGRPMNMAGREGDVLWFVADMDSRKVEEVISGDPAIVTCQSSTEWIAATGEVTLNRDRAKIDDLWSEPMRAWFPDGPDAPGIVALRVDLFSGEYWSVSGGDLVSFAFGVAKSMITRERIDPDKEGDHGEVRL